MTNEYISTERTTIAMLTLKTYGTKDQNRQSIEKLKSEIKLQGFDVEISDIHVLDEPLEKRAPKPELHIQCGRGHRTRWRKPNEWILACGCVAIDATDEAIFDFSGGGQTPEDFRAEIIARGPAPQ